MHMMVKVRGEECRVLVDTVRDFSEDPPERKVLLTIEAPEPYADLTPSDARVLADALLAAALEQEAEV